MTFPGAACPTPPYVFLSGQAIWLDRAKNLGQAGTRAALPQPGRDFFALAPPVRFSIVLRVRFSLPREVAMSSAELESARLESLEVGAAPLVRHFLNRLALPELFA